MQTNSFDKIIGQDKVKKMIRLISNASKLKNKFESILLIDANPNEDFEGTNLKYSVFLTAEQVEQIRNEIYRFTFIFEGDLSGEFNFNQQGMGLGSPLVTTYVNEGENVIIIPLQVAEDVTLLQAYLNPS